MGRLDGQVALVTGCARLKGLGRGMALALAEAGAHVAIADLAAGGTRNVLEAAEDEARAGWKGLDSLAAEIAARGRRALPLLGDVGLRDDAERIVQETLNAWGRIDLLVNNAAAPQGADRTWAWEVPEDAFDLVVRVNVKGVFLMSVAVVRHMLARGGPGRIVNIASVVGKMGLAKRAVYSASKAAVIGLTQAMAQELAPHGITVNAICPGVIDTARNRSLRAREAASAQALAAGREPVVPDPPVGRKGTAADIARLVVFLADPAGDFITGQAINVDGGWVMH